ncbi:MAG: GNAT family N-acetyltransferase [Acidobacteriota bacterium]
MSVNVVPAVSASDLALVRELFLEYARSLDFELCFQSFDDELAGLPGKYEPPSGRLYLATVNGQTAGCIALRQLDAGICEMKRLWVRPDYRRHGVGRALSEQLLSDARQIGYRAMRLDTIGATMRNAVGLYRSLGFREIPAYYDNPIPGALYLELTL